MSDDRVRPEIALGSPEASPPRETVFQRGLHSDPVYPPRPVKPGDDYLTRLDRIRTWRKKAAQELEVESDIILPKDLMLLIAEKDPKTLKELGEILHETPWRFKTLGAQMLHALTTHTKDKK